MNPAKYMVDTRSVLTIYRDCHKLIYRMVNDPTKAAAAHVLLRKQFEKNKQEFDTGKINQLKMNAVKGISNYLIFTVQKDYKMLGKKPINIHEEEDELEHLHEDNITNNDDENREIRIEEIKPNTK